MRKKSKSLSLREAIELGEYHKEYLSQFPDWLKLSRSSQHQLIREAIRNRRNQLRKEYADVFNVLNFSKKPELQSVLDGIVQKIQSLDDDEEHIWLEYFEE
jgi:hypothetical protein